MTMTEEKRITFRVSVALETRPKYIELDWIKELDDGNVQVRCFLRAKAYIVTLYPNNLFKVAWDTTYNKWK